MAYIALYRKYRPNKFEDVVGQSHITRTLKNQIENNNIAHAYLFCGTRGTGKTSTAKIFARAVNCLNPIDNNPCNECEICLGILNESIMDVIEIDAASNNGVDDVREIRENVKYPPTKGKYKVYIVDEVHMLSTGAFNALLKTLEEPPHYVIFILATTEPHKIPATILSRCQRFDLKRIKEDDISGTMESICGSMNIHVDRQALELIARNSDGALRDALSILDQCVSINENNITYDNVIDILGTVNDSYLLDLVDNIKDENTKECMKLIENLVDSGKDIHQFIKVLITHYRNLMMSKISDDLGGIINLSKENIQRLCKQSESLSMNSISRSINLLSKLSADAKWASQPRVLLELTIIKLSSPQVDNSVEGLLDRIESLERRIKTGQINVVSNPVPMEEVNEKPKEDAKEEVKKEIKPATVVSRGDRFNSIKNNWEGILKVIKKKKISLHAVLIEGSLVGFKNNKLVISFGDAFSFHKEMASQGSDFIQSVMKEMYGESIGLDFVMESHIKNLSVKKEDEPEEPQNEEAEVEKIKEKFGEFNLEIL
ncbi:MAG: DNA polymerase III subunit gamma/tau [Anaeromicrobium sp.]|jgi:DNA polymerase-3 subunit gamma/tau|uniref:DNA polymerase III subunit gamma/tau n=1 Tax=Anaeromicrobium sp. TaxID=1929132 RepID=UPI0025CCABE5|nr:DNA polymerase III subunit gamma/tau [Anaeromicrobium sp.]MCT4593609.1 DNA polymerase III subunit gamma/tau [Anaeromicrobium sp.]